MHFLGSGVNSVNQRMADLELSLYNCIQNVQIDAIALQFHPAIVESQEQVFPHHISSNQHLVLQTRSLRQTRRSQLSNRI